jgi:hypothetical protein
MINQTALFFIKNYKNQTAKYWLIVVCGAALAVYSRIVLINMLDSGDFFNPVGMTARGRGRCQPEVNNLFHVAAADYHASHGEHVGMVVFAAVSGNIKIVATSCSYAGNLIGSHTGTNAGPVNYYAETVRVLRHARSNKKSYVGIVD